MPLHLTESPFAGAMDVVASGTRAASSYRLLLSTLGNLEAPTHERVKARPTYIYDQTRLQAMVRERLMASGWLFEVELLPKQVVDGVRLAEIKSDLIGPDCIVILDFGNRTSWSHNLVTRVVGSLKRVPGALTVFVTPTDAFAKRIDSNLGTFERVTSELRFLTARRPEMVPGPLMLVGVEPIDMPPVR